MFIAFLLQIILIILVEFNVEIESQQLLQHYNVQPAKTDYLNAPPNEPLLNHMFPKLIPEPVVYTVEVLLVIDWSIYLKYMRFYKNVKADAINGLRYYFCHVINGVDYRYGLINDPDLKFKIRLAGYHIAKTQKDSLFTESIGIKTTDQRIHAQPALEYFRTWLAQKVQVHGKGGLPNFDAALLFTDYELIGFEGLAFKKTVCDASAVAINRDTGMFGAIDTATHELGHILGAEHDDDGRCDPNLQNIMASMKLELNDYQLINRNHFSACSLIYFKTLMIYRNALGTNCLINPSNHGDVTWGDYIAKQPGQIYTPDIQCQMMYGPGSFYCAGGGDEERNKCRKLLCWDPKNKGCMISPWRRAFDGTSCGNKKWCQNGFCVENQLAPEAKDSCLNGDIKPWIVMTSGVVTCHQIGIFLTHWCNNAFYAEKLLCHLSNCSR